MCVLGVLEIDRVQCVKQMSSTTSTPNESPVRAPPPTANSNNMSSLVMDSGVAQFLQTPEKVENAQQQQQITTKKKALPDDVFRQAVIAAQTDIMLLGTNASSAVPTALAAGRGRGKKKGASLMQYSPDTTVRQMLRREEGRKQHEADVVRTSSHSSVECSSLALRSSEPCFLCGGTRPKAAGGSKQGLGGSGSGGGSGLTVAQQEVLAGIRHWAYTLRRVA